MKMQDQGVYPDPKIFVTIIGHLSEQGNWDLIESNLEKMKFRGHEKSSIIYGILVDIFEKFGRFQDAGECIEALKSEGVELSASIFCVSECICSTGILRRDGKSSSARGM